MLMNRATRPLGSTSTLDLVPVGSTASNLEIGDLFQVMTHTSRSGTFATTTGVVLSSTDGLAVLYNPGDVTVRVSLRGDTNLDDDVDTGDLTRMFQNFNGDGSSGRFWVDGDHDGDGDVDTGDLTTGFQNFTGALADNNINPDLIYNPNNGAVKIDADGANMLSFNLQSAAQFSPPNPDANFADLDDNVGFGTSTFVDNTDSTIGWISVLALANIGFVGPEDAQLGHLLPTGLDLAGLTALLTNKAWGGAGGLGGDFDLVVQVPEPGSVVLLGIGLLGLGFYGRHRKPKLAA